MDEGSAFFFGINLCDGDAVQVQDLSKGCQAIVNFAVYSIRWKVDKGFRQTRHYLFEFRARLQPIRMVYQCGLD